MELNENQNLGGVWREEPSLSNIEEEGQSKQKTTFLIGERKIEPQNAVVFENRVFFVERTSECLIIRPKTAKEYLKLARGTRRMVKFERKAKDILIPTVAEKPMKWFEQKYVENRKRNQQGRFICEVWKHRKEVFGEVIVG